MSDVLFIGGSADGLMVSMPHVMPTCVVTRPSEAAMSLGSPADVPSIVPTLRDLYYAEMLRVGETRFFLYRFDKLSMVDAVRVLIDGYSKKAKP